MKDNINIKNVTFRYQADSPFILEDLSIEVPAGSFIALVGPTWSGKSTLFRLPLAFEKIKNDTVFYDVHDINSLNKKALRKQLCRVTFMKTLRAFHPI